MNDKVVINLWKNKNKQENTMTIPIRKIPNIIREIEQKNRRPEKIDDKLIQLLLEEYEDEMGKHAIWRGFITKQFIKWLEEYE